MSASASEAPKLLLIGTAFLAGAVVLGWLSSPATMRLERTVREPARSEHAKSEPAPLERLPGEASQVERPQGEAAQGDRADGEPSQVERARAETSRLERARGESATVTIESWLFGLIGLGAERIDGVRSATMVDSRAPGSDSDTPPHMVLVTTAGAVNIGRAQQLFARDFAAIESFFEASAEPQLTLSSIARSSERTRFAVAQIVTLFLGLTGLGLLWLGIKGLRS